MCRRSDFGERNAEKPIPPLALHSTTVTRPPPDRLQDAFDSALLGNLDPAQHILSGPPIGDSADEFLWRATLDLVLAAYRPDRLPDAEIDVVWAALGETGTQEEPRFAALAVLRKVGLARRDLTILRRCADFESSRSHTPAGLVVIGWLRGLETLPGTGSYPIGEEASRAAGRPGLVVEAAAERALLALHYGRHPEALNFARRASRMARSEGRIPDEYLAHLVLARVRRHTGKVHLAVRILSALEAVAPAVWLDWIHWEQWMAGVVPSRVPVGEGPGEKLGRVLTAMQRQAYDELPHLAEVLLAETRRLPAFRLEAEALLVAADPRADVWSSDQSIQRWVRGEGSAVPFGLTSQAHRGTASPLVVGVPDEPGRRVLPIGLGFFAADDDLRLYDSRQPDHRVHTAISVLALAGPTGLSTADFFEKVYEFSYRAERHSGPLRVLVHRVRSTVGDAAELRRDGDHLSLQIQRRLLVPDPRCAVSLEARVLQRLAASGGRATVTQLAEELQIPRRTVQDALAQLVSDGACQAEKFGRRYEYRIEDTTFTNPTTHRLRVGAST